jgi:hypothetical protein
MKEYEEQRKAKNERLEKLKNEIDQIMQKVKKEKFDQEEMRKKATEAQHRRFEELRQAKQVNANRFKELKSPKTKWQSPFSKYKAEEKAIPSPPPSWYKAYERQPGAHRTMTGSPIFSPIDPIFSPVKSDTHRRHSESARRSQKMYVQDIGSEHVPQEEVFNIAFALELLESEEHHAEMLALLVERIALPLMTADEILSMDEYVDLFGQVESLKKLHKAFLTELEEYFKAAFEPGSEESMIDESISLGDLLIKHEEMIISYIEYCKNAEKIHDTIDLIMETNPAFSLFIDTQLPLLSEHFTSSKFKGQPVSLHMLLLSPVQEVVGTYIWYCVFAIRAGS